MSEPLDKLKTVVAYTAYILLFTALLPFLLLRLYWRSRRAPAYAKRITERFGLSEIRPKPGGIWIHAVSVGEAIAISSTIKKLLEKSPGQSITVTTTTPTGSDRIVSMFGESVHHVYAPYDWPLFVWIFLNRVKPGLAVVVETELWPVTLALCSLRGTRVLIANARLSEKSARGYQKIRWLVEPVLRHVSVAAQHSADVQRFRDLGVEEQHVTRTGSVKFDIEVSDAQRSRAMELKSLFAINDDEFGASVMRFVWIAASTHQGEDEVVISAHSQLLKHSPDSLLIIVPRHPERFDYVANLLEKKGIGFVRRSEGKPPLADTRALLVDTMGELTDFYGVADIAFLGGSLVPVGGHNYLEASVWGLPVISGPHRHNFLAIAAELESIGALTVVHDAEEILQQLVSAIDHPRNCREAGNRAARLIAENRGATEKLLSLIESQEPGVIAG